VTVTGDKDNKTGAVVANLKYKFSDKERGLVFTQTIKTSNAVSGQLEVTDTIVKGLKLDLETNLNDTGYLFFV
jgi:voltage-dependent anion channel protein 2